MTQSASGSTAARPGTPQALTELLAPVVQGTGLFLERVEVTRAGRFSTVRVVVDLLDGPGDLDLDGLTEVTQAVSSAMDEADPVKGQYQLEVSTPGAERELTTPRHWRRAVGHDVEVTAGGDPSSQVLAGTLVSVSDQQAVLETAPGQTVGVDLGEVVSARTTVTW